MIHPAWLELVEAVINQLHARLSSGPSQRYILLDNARIHWQHGTLRSVWLDQPAPIGDWAFIDMRHLFQAELVKHSEILAAYSPENRLALINQILNAMESLCGTSPSSVASGS